jgi:hypothetical protein
MKITFVTLMILCAATALGQTAGVIPNQPVMLYVPDHPQQALPHAMGIEHSLVGGGSDTYTYARGERPLWEFGPVSEPVPLGDVARAYRKEKLTAKKAQVIFEKQGFPPKQGL